MFKQNSEERKYPGGVAVEMLSFIISKPCLKRQFTKTALVFEVNLGYKIMVRLGVFWINRITVIVQHDCGGRTDWMCMAEQTMT